MGGSYLGDAGIFLIQTIFGLYILLVMLRFLFQVVRADFYNPVSQFIVKATNPPLKPLRRIIPGYRGVDVSAIVLILALKYLELFSIGFLKGYDLHPLGILVLSFSELLGLIINVFFFSILIQVVISWVNPGAYNPILSIIYSLNEPLMRPARKLIPPMSGFDLSPLVVMIVLQLMKILIVSPINDVGGRLLLGGG